MTTARMKVYGLVSLILEKNTINGQRISYEEASSKKFGILTVFVRF